MADPAEPKAVVEAEKKKEQSVPFYKLFSCADGLDLLLMSLGSLGAVVHGSAMPVFFLFFGDLVNGFGKNQEDPSKMTHEVSKVSDTASFLLLSLRLHPLFFLRKSVANDGWESPVDEIGLSIFLDPFVFNKCSTLSTSSISDWLSVPRLMQVCIIFSVSSIYTFILSSCFSLIVIHVIHLQTVPIVPGLRFLSSAVLFGFFWRSEMLDLSEIFFPLLLSPSLSFSLRYHDRMTVYF